MSASTVILNGLTTHDYGTYYPYFAIRNDSGGAVYASTTNPECTPDAEGVVSIANGDGYMAANTDNDNTCLYLSGTGKVTVIAQHDKLFPFEKAQGGGDSGTASGSVVGLQIGKIVDEPVSACVSASELPYTFPGNAVVYNDEIHIFGDAISGNTKHYKYNGSSWESVSTLPYEFHGGAAFIYNDEIHILGGGGGNTKHYKYNGSSWESVSTLPYEFYDGSAVVYNGEIHILGGFYSTSSTSHYKFDGASWTSVSTLPYEFYGGAAVVYANRINILGGSKSATSHYSYNGSNWSSYSTLPYELRDGAAVMYKGKIHILGGYNTNHYKFQGSYWQNVSTLPYEFYGGAAVMYKGEIHILDFRNHHAVKNDNRHIATMLPKGTHIMLSDNEDINYTSNATRISSNIAEVTETGYVELLASIPELYAAKGYLTFY